MCIRDSYSTIDLMNWAGTPAATVFASKSLVTTAQAPMTTLSPMVTPCRIVALEPIHTFLPNAMGAG